MIDDSKETVMDPKQKVVIPKQKNMNSKQQGMIPKQKVMTPKQKDMGAFIYSQATRCQKNPPRQFIEYIKIYRQ